MPGLLRSTLLLLTAASAAVPTAAAQTDSVGRHSLFTWNDAVLAGTFVAGTVLLYPADRSFAERLQNPQNQENRFYQDVATFVRTTADPGALLIGVTMYAAGRLTKSDRFADLGLHGLEALVVGAAVANVGKFAFGRGRPYITKEDGSFYANNWDFGRGAGNKDYRSFPSGHTTAAFAAAAAVTNEAARWKTGSEWVVGPILFGGAALTGLSRMYNNRHWLSDVVMGAAIGTFAGNKVVRYHHRVNPDNRIDQWLLSVNVRPTPDGAQLAFSLVPASVMPAR